VIWQLLKDERLRDNPINPNWEPGQSERLLPLYTADQPEVHDVVAELRRVVDEFDARVLIGEIYLPLERLVGRDGARTPMQWAPDAMGPSRVTSRGSRSPAIFGPRTSSTSREIKPQFSTSTGF
jgi:hypothetical protein